MEVKRVVVYEYAGVNYEKATDALAYQQFVRGLLNKNMFLLSTKPDLRDGLGYYEKHIAVVEDMNSFRDYLEDLSETVPEDARAYQIEGPYSFNTEEDLVEFIQRDYSVGVGRYTTAKKLEIEYI